MTASRRVPPVSHFAVSFGIISEGFERQKLGAAEPGQATPVGPRNRGKNWDAPAGVVRHPHRLVREGNAFDVRADDDGRITAAVESGEDNGSADVGLRE